MKKTHLILLTIVLLFSCASDEGPGYQEPYIPNSNNPVIEPLTDQELMDLVQEKTFKYFWDFANSPSGAAKERYHPNNPSLNQNVVTTGGSGFGLMAIIIGIERGYITRDQGIQRLTTILDFFETADRFHGAWPHWIDGASGQVIPFSPEDNGGDLVETAFLAQGLICVKEYFKTDQRKNKP